MYYICGESCRECINSPYRPDRCEQCTFAIAVDFLNKYKDLVIQYRELIKRPNAIIGKDVIIEDTNRH